MREALCFGWIDSLIKRVDDDRYTHSSRRRNSTSKWSNVNRKRWTELEAEGLLAPARPGPLSPTENRYAEKPAIPVLPAYFRESREGEAYQKAWAFFQALAPTYRRHFVVWCHMAKRPETREKRLREAVAVLAAGRKLGLK